MFTREADLVGNVAVKHKGHCLVYCKVTSTVTAVRNLPLSVSLMTLTNEPL